ncbi:MAG: sortase [Chloroflexia bacterium]
MADQGLTSTELEKLLLRRRRQEAVEGLRLLPPLAPDTTETAEMKPILPAGLLRPGSGAPRTEVALPRSEAPAEETPPSPTERWLSRPAARLQPLQNRARPRRPSHPLLNALKRGLARVVDMLIVVALVLFILAVGFWLYDTYLRPLLYRPGEVAEARGEATFWPGQGYLSPPQEWPSAPLPFVPYTTTQAAVIPAPNPYIPVPTPAPGTLLPTRLVIPAIELDTPVKEVTIENGVWQVAEYAAGYHRGTARPGTVGNTVISGHKGLYGGVFARLEELNVGDEVFLYAGPHLYRYIVEEKKSVWPHQVEVMAQTARPILTLITCTAYDTQRLIVIARLDREVSGEAGP